MRNFKKDLGIRATFFEGNRISPADVYPATGNTVRAIELYESSLTNGFAENEHVLSQLIVAYFKKG